MFGLRGDSSRAVGGKQSTGHALRSSWDGRAEGLTRPQESSTQVREPAQRIGFEDAVGRVGCNGWLGCRVGETYEVAKSMRHRTKRTSSTRASRREIRAITPVDTSITSMPARLAVLPTAPRITAGVLSPLTPARIHAAPITATTTPTVFTG